MKRRRLRFGTVAVFLAVLGCATVVVDPSIQAVDAGDLTLATSACAAVPGGGLDSCLLREGTAIDSSWRLYVPIGGTILGSEVDVYYRDVQPPHLEFPAGQRVLEIPWKDLFKAEKWSREMDGEAMALVLVRYKTPEGIEEIAKYRGIAKLIVTAAGYERMPIDSGFAAWKETFKCKVQYSTAGRSAVSCK